MNLREAAQQALEALEDSHQNINPERRYADELTRQIADAITSLRAALSEDRSADTGKTSDHIAAANKMVATIRQDVTVEPVAWSYTDAKGRTVVVIANTAPYEDAKPLYPAPPKRKPINTDMILATWVEECIPKRSTPELVVAFARAIIERAHGIGGEE